MTTVKTVMSTSEVVVSANGLQNGWLLFAGSQPFVPCSATPVVCKRLARQIFNKAWSHFDKE